MKQFIGLDAHSKTCTFAVIDKEGLLLSKHKVETSEKNILNVVRSIKGKTKLVFEETNIAQWLHILLKEEVNELVVCNPCYIGKKQGPKNDFKDALHLANELRCNHIVPVFHEDNFLIKMRIIISSYSSMVKDCTRAKNRYKAIFRSKGIKTQGGSKFYTIEDLMNELKDEEDQFTSRSLFEQITTLEKQKTKFKARFDKYKKDYSVIKNLSTIPGIDSVRAITIASLICSAERFENKHKLWSYAMLVKHFEESDGVIYSKKTKYGRKELKDVYMGAAETILKTNSSLRKYYDNLRSKGIDHKKAKKSVARRIAAISLQIMKKEIKYDDNFLEKKKRSSKL